MLHVNHGASEQHGGRAAAWESVTIHRWNGTRLTHAIGVFDFEGRRRQLESGVPSRAPAPMLAPWDASFERPDPAALKTVHDWLDRGEFVDIEDLVYEGVEWPLFSRIIQPSVIVIEELFGSANRVAFKVRFEGAYAGGLDLEPTLEGSPATMHMAGIVAVEGSRISGRIVRSRYEMRRDLVGVTP